MNARSGPEFPAGRIYFDFATLMRQIGTCSGDLRPMRTRMSANSSWVSSS